MLTVIAEDFINPGHIDTVLPLYKELVAKTREEEACLRYDLYLDKNKPGHFIFMEEWPDQNALDKHCRTEHFTRLVPLINHHQEKPGTFLFMTQRIEPDPLHDQATPNALQAL